MGIGRLHLDKERKMSENKEKDEELEEWPARHLGDDGREGHEGEGRSRDALELADRNVKRLMHSPNSFRLR